MRLDDGEASCAVGFLSVRPEEIALIDLESRLGSFFLCGAIGPRLDLGRLRGC